MTPPTPPEKLQAVREWIVKACPELITFGTKCCRRGMHVKSAVRTCTGCLRVLSDTEQVLNITDIGIAEVLRAYRESHGLISKMLLVNDGGWFVLGLTPPKKKIQWNLSDDSLDQQKPEVIDFLFSLIPQ